MSCRCFMLATSNASPIQKLTACDELSHNVDLARTDVYCIQLDAIWMRHLHHDETFR